MCLAELVPRLDLLRTHKRTWCSIVRWPFQLIQRNAAYLIWTSSVRHCCSCSWVFVPIFSSRVITNLKELRLIHGLTERNLKNTSDLRPKLSSGTRANDWKKKPTNSLHKYKMWNLFFSSLVRQHRSRSVKTVPMWWKVLTFLSLIDSLIAFAVTITILQEHKLSKRSTLIILTNNIYEILKFSLLNEIPEAHYIWNIAWLCFSWAYTI